MTAPRSGPIPTWPAARSWPVGVGSACTRVSGGSTRFRSSAPRTSRTMSPPRSSCRRVARTGVIVAQGGLVGGWAMYAKNGRPVYCYNFYGVDLFYVEGTEPLPEGRHQVRMSFEYDGGGVAKGGTVRLFVDDRQVGEGRVERTQPLPFASDEPFEIARDLGSPVTPDYSAREFNGEVDVGRDRPARGFAGQRPRDLRRRPAPGRVDQGVVTWTSSSPGSGNWSRRHLPSPRCSRWECA